jgi:hypothetical protein
MIGRETEVTAAGVGLRRSAGEATGALVRPLGAFERLYYRRQQKSTMHFCMVAELADDIDPFTLAAALRAVQQRHPLLNVYVQHRPQTGLGFTDRRMCRRSRSPSSTPRPGAAGAMLSPPS